MAVLTAAPSADKLVDQWAGRMVVLTAGQWADRMVVLKADLWAEQSVGQMAGQRVGQMVDLLAVRMAD